MPALKSLSDPLVRYRTMAWTVGVLLIILFPIGVPLKYAANQDAVVAIVGPLHGFLYIVYLVVAFDLAMRRRWVWWKTLVVLGAGTVPFLSFIVERWVTRHDRDWQQRKAQETVAAES